MERRGEDDDVVRMECAIGGELVDSTRLESTTCSDNRQPTRELDT